MCNWDFITTKFDITLFGRRWLICQGITRNTDIDNYENPTSADICNLSNFSSTNFIEDNLTSNESNTQK